MARIVALLAGCLVVLLAPSAEAAFPGANGRIAFDRNVSGNWDVYSMDADGTDESRLTTDPATDAYPAWSPDGRRLAFVSFRTGNGDIYVMNADGTGATRLTTSVDPESRPAWSPDGTRIAFARRDGGSACESSDPALAIWTMNADGTGQAPLTAMNGSETDPAWSPDGGTIAFSVDERFYGDCIFGARVWKTPAGGGTPTLISGPECEPGNACRYHIAPDWSPDGTRIVFSDWNNWGDSAGLTLIAPDGSGTFAVTSDHTDGFRQDYSPAWSPDRTRIAFGRSGYDPDTFAELPSGIYLINPDGSNPTFVAPGNNPDWQPRITGYPRPKSTDGLHSALVPAATPCTAPNANHGPAHDRQAQRRRQRACDGAGRRLPRHGPVRHKRRHDGRVDLLGVDDRRRGHPRHGDRVEALDLGARAGAAQ
jgi:Tol biopolymer transport system component